jgi:hypothetical protein
MTSLPDLIGSGFALGFWALLIFWGLTIPIRALARMLGLAA